MEREKLGQGLGSGVLSTCSSCSVGDAFEALPALVGRQPLRAPKATADNSTKGEPSDGFPARMMQDAYVEAVNVWGWPWRLPKDCVHANSRHALETISSLVVTNKLLVHNKTSTEWHLTGPHQNN